MADPNWIQTFTGRQVWPLRMRPEDVDIKDVAHALSMLCRFNGHSLRYYSVAEHSVRVSRALPADLALWGLLHDAGEAYLSDLPRPVKRQLPEFGEYEDKVLRVVADKYGLIWPMPKEVATADTRLLVTEARDLMLPPPDSWGIDLEPLPGEITPWPAEEAEKAYLDAFEKLK